MLNKIEKLAFEQIAKHKKEITALSITLSNQSENNKSEIQSIKNDIATREENIQSIIQNYIESIPIVKDGENGKDADEVNYNLIEEKISLKVKEDVSKIELPKAEQVNYKIIMEAINNAVKNIPKAKDGEKGQAGKKGKDAVEVDYSKIVTEVLSKIKDKTIGIKDISFKLGILKITLTDGTKKTFKLPRQVSGIHSEKVISVPTPYTNLMPVPTTLGGVEAGTTFDNVPINEVLNNLLYPYQAPAFTSFTISGLASTTYELGYTFPANDYTFVWSTSNQANIQADSIILNSIPDLANDGI
jgi:hypothetical protein